MHMLKTAFFASFFATTLVGAAMADRNASTSLRNPEIAREQIERLYRLEQAFLACDNVRLTGQDLKRLDDAISEFELTSGLAASDLETIYEQVEAAATDAPGNFCADMQDVTGEIRSIPVSERQ